METIIVREIEPQIYCFDFSGHLSYDRQLLYHKKLASMNPPARFVLIGTFENATVPRVSMEIFPFLDELRKLYSIDGYVAVGVPLVMQPAWWSVVTVTQITKTIQFASTIEEAIVKAQAILAR